MKKQAFTLAEVLITICLVGVVAAITAPMVTGLIPDKNKVRVMKYKRVISNINQEILDSSPYLEYSDPENCIGFRCMQSSRYKESFTGRLYDNGTSNKAYAAFDGSYWAFDKLNDSEDGNFKITISIGASSGCTYNSDSCPKPTAFVFKVDSLGHVYGYDKLTKAYLKNPTKMNDKKHDYEVADTLSDG